jgi:hypothetical protein
MGPTVDQFGQPFENGLVLAVAKSADFAGASTNWIQYDITPPLTNIIMAFPTLAVGPKHLYITFSAVLTSGYATLRSLSDAKCTRSCLHTPGDVARCRALGDTECCWSPLCGSLQLLLFMHYWVTSLLETRQLPHF